MWGVSQTRRRNGARRHLTAVMSPVLLLAAGILFSHAAHAEKGVTEGTFRDRDDKPHSWSVERSHVLTWEGKPYTPAGVVFHSAFLEAPTDATLQQDSAELDRLKAAGILDIWVDSGRGLLQSTAEQTQTLIDALESRGFRYGLRVGDRSREPLVGFSPTLQPYQIPAARLQPGAREVYEVKAPRARRVIYNLVDVVSETTQGMSVNAGATVVERDLARVELTVRKSALLGKAKGLLHVVPEIQLDPEEIGSFGDLWSGMESYAGRLEKRLESVKFGPGLRFIMDPFVAGDGTVGQEDTLFPSSEQFRTAFSEWLAKRYGILALNNNWRLRDKRVPGFKEAGRMIPMWDRNDPPDGDGWMIDPVENVAYRCIPRDCSIWTELDTFRADTLKRWMNVLAINVKQDGLDVPMIFTWSAYHPIFNNSPSPSGYDGLGAQVYGVAPEIATRSGAYALAQAEEADRNAWLFAARLAGPRDPNGNPSEIKDAGSLRSAWSALREAGFRGVYLDPRELPNAIPMAKDLASSIASESAALQEKVQVCFFPMPLATADRITRLKNGVWWLPSGHPARLLRYGDTIFGYEIDRPLGEEHVVRRGTVLWSTSGEQEVTFHHDIANPFELYDSAGLPLKPKIKKFQVRMKLTEEPVVLTGVNSTQLFPFELALLQLAEFDALMTQAEKQKLDVSSMRVIKRNAEEGLTPASAPLVYNQLAPHVATLRDALMPFVWTEFERSSAHNLTGIAFQAGASGGTYLKLDRAEAPPSGVYKSRLAIDIRRDASYEIWCAGRVPGRPGNSPLIWQIDDEPAVSLPSATPLGEDYTTGMAWYQLGRVALKAGRHTLTIVVPEKAPGPGGRYSAGLDAVVLTRDAFKPNGIQKPHFRTAAAKSEKSEKPEKPEKTGKSKKSEE